jgi:hypothetical protein
MKITVGVKSIRETEYFLDAGADEVYCGLLGLHNNGSPTRTSPASPPWKK